MRSLPTSLALFHDPRSSNSSQWMTSARMKPALQVGVDHARALGRLRAGAERPGPRLLVAGREEGAQAEQVVRRARDARERAVAEAESEEHLGPFVGLELRGLRFELHAHAEHLRDLAELGGDRRDHRRRRSAGLRPG